MVAARERLGRRSTARRVLAVVLAAFVAGALAWHQSLREIEARLDQSLILTLRALETEIDRFRYLPAVTGEDARIRTAIAAPFNPSAIDYANRYLETVTALASASHLYLMDAEGLTLAASNWRIAESFVGNNYAFRPYFREALETGAGGFYAIGVTTNTPGYFLAARIDLPGTIGGAHGVVVVKVDLTPLQQAWQAAGQATAVADADGVVFLSGVPGWMYRPLRPLTDAAQARLAEQRTYQGSNVATAAPLLDGSGRWISESGLLRVTRSAPFEKGWQVVAAAPVRPALLAALGWGGAAALATGLGLGLAQIQRQRRQLVALRLRQSDLLERKVAERTEALGREIEARRATEGELRAAQEVLVQTEKMAALGRMSAAIVHEISQPLAAMEATLAAAEISLPTTPEKTATRIETARGLIKRMQRTTKHLKSFSRKESGPFEPVDARAAAESALELVRPRVRAVVPRLEAPEAPLMVRAGRVRLEQVLVNLLMNALDAVEGLEGAEVVLRLATEGAEARLSVRDTGPGIAPENLARVTEPFFSTKTASEGLGLGLAISQAILAEFGGRLEMISEPGQGAEMVAVVPLVEGV